VVHDHVRRHVFDFVALETPRQRRPASGRFKLFYVDARAGLLRLNKLRPFR
jgi:hypothetical protein